MKTLMLCNATLDGPDHQIISLYDDHPAVAFCAKWEKTGGTAWIDGGGDDTPECERLLRTLDAIPDQGIKLPCQIDMVIHVTRY